jgi:predicted secreted protein
MKTTYSRSWGAALCWAALGAHAQTPPASAPQNVLTLSAVGNVEVQQDLLRLQLGTTRDGTDAAAVQAQLKAALDAGLAEARTSASPGQMDVRTGPFSLQPRYSRDGRINGWNGAAELVLEGRDFGRITQTAARIQTLTVRGVGFALSREERSRVESEAQAAAIAGFKAKAAELASGFGFGGYALREVAVSASDGTFEPRARMVAMESRAAGADMPVPVEPGKTNVSVTVSGSVQLR